MASAPQLASGTAYHCVVDGTAGAICGSQLNPKLNPEPPAQ
jgi:hypothetical protein